MKSGTTPTTAALLAVPTSVQHVRHGPVDGSPGGCGCRSNQHVSGPSSVPYDRLRLECTGKRVDGQFDLNPIFDHACAPMTLPTAGVVIEGILVDCPVLPGCPPCLVLDTPRGVEAFASHALGNFVIENAPCHLEFRAVEVCEGCGCRRWDWEVHEISRSGRRTLVSEPRPDAPHPDAARRGG